MLWMLVLLASVAGQEIGQIRDPWARMGELSIYSSETENGTIAKRDLRNEAGQVVKVIYYALSADSPGRAHWPLRREEITEDMLVPHLLEDKAHDDAGRLRWARREGEGSIRTEQIVYAGAGKKTHTFVTWRNSSGDSYYQNDYAPDGRMITIESDASGRPLGFEGGLPTDLAQAFEWGEPKSGFAFSLSTSPVRGPRECIRLLLTVRNVAGREREAPLEIWPEIELRDSRGLVLPQTTRAEQQGLRAARLRGKCGESSRLLRPGEGYTAKRADLLELYKGLTPGPYSVVLRHCVGPNSTLASSNTAHFTVE